jgi:RNA polymerase sigma-70 factor, ECF subfamily
MYLTSVSLLQRLRQPEEKEAWDRFVKLYTPMLYHWARRVGLAEHDAADLVQDVFVLLVRKLPEFVYDDHRSFRGWLHTVLRNKYLERMRVKRPVLALGSGSEWPALQEVDGFVEEEEYRTQLVRRALQLMKSDFEELTWKACWEYVVMDRKPAELADELGVSVDVIYSAKSRVLRRLRQELAGLWE